MKYEETTQQSKRYRDNAFDNIPERILKMPNRLKTKVYNFNCLAYCKGEIFDFQLSQTFTAFKFAVLFFCTYDFTTQSKEDLLHIQSFYSKFIEFGALPIVITQDRAQIHSVYATPGKTTGSLDFVPSFLMVSDSTDRLISKSYKSMNMKTLTIQRSVVIIDSNLYVLFKHQVADKKYFPMASILNCFEQTQIV